MRFLSIPVLFLSRLPLVDRIFGSRVQRIKVNAYMTELCCALKKNFKRVILEEMIFKFGCSVNF
jgi:hypothetical protein